MTAPQRLDAADLLAWAVVLEYRAQQQRDGITILLLPYPPCPVCGGQIHGHDSATVERGIRSEVTITLRPCRHQFATDDDVLHDVWSHCTAIVGDLDDADHGRRRPGSWVPDHWGTGHVIEQAKARLAHDNGPTIREAADNDRRWDFEKAGE